MSKRILIVEDDLLIAHVLETYVSECGTCELVGSTDNGDEAIEIADKEKPDCILMDIRIEGDKDGIETARIINQKHNIPIIYTSGNTDEKTTARASQTNMLAFLPKPINKKSLLDILARNN